MFLIFALGRLDVLPVTDFGLRSGMRREHALPDLPDRATLLELDATLQVGDGALALVGVRHRQDHIDARVVMQLLRGGQDQPRKGTGV